MQPKYEAKEPRPGRWVIYKRVQDDQYTVVCAIDTDKGLTPNQALMLAINREQSCKQWIYRKH